MKKEQEINNQWRVLHKIYNNQNGIFDWEDMKQAIDALICMEILKIDPYYFDEK